MKLSNNMRNIFVLVIVNSLSMYYANYFRDLGGYFSEGVLVGWLYGIVFCISLLIMYLFIRMIYLNWRVRWKEKK